VKADLTQRLVDLYTHHRFSGADHSTIYRSRTKNFFRGTVNYDGWENKLQHIKDSDRELALTSETAMSAPVSVS
jgi:hypothetical protein